MSGAVADGVVRISGGATGTDGGLLLDDGNAPGTACCVGSARLAPGERSSAAVVHSCDELVYVVTGTGALHDVDGTGGAIGFGAGDVLLIRAGTWHRMVNTGAGDLVTAYFFPTPRRPRTAVRTVEEGV